MDGSSIFVLTHCRCTDLTDTSTLAWSLSFYPQPILNFRRHSTTGSTIDFPTINVIGFICYFLSNSFLRFSPLIRAQYAARNPVSPEPTVRVNDVAFAAHAVVLSVATWSMFWGRLWGFEQKSGQKISKGVLGIGFGCIVGLAWVTATVLATGVNGGRDPGRWAWIDVVSPSCAGSLRFPLLQSLETLRKLMRRARSTR